MVRHATSRSSASTAIRRHPAAKKKSATTTKKWSQKVLERSNALDLEEGVFTRQTPRQVALSLKRSADRSRRRKSDPYRSAMSMLSFHINRAGRSLSAERRRVLAGAKVELRRLYGKETRAR